MCDTLLVKHLPSAFTEHEREIFLKRFGAKDVQCFASQGPMKNAALARFSSAEEAELALLQLHQIKVHGKRLVIIYFFKEEEGQRRTENAWFQGLTIWADKRFMDNIDYLKYTLITVQHPPMDGVTNSFYTIAIT
ncbi:unnamed protein product [Darwinula stevensoni]|uniref:RNA-binding protein n=1 Tax=Darwinula stevensoni TaxID=69355 RepID=A0A7R8XDA4_9CRUS|nr:unnamed protein product [Darwinula stevensoni]CAG0888466.1 unnamed protein product [Darwinula stevensoni]